MAGIQEHQSNSFVAAKCKVSATTVKRYRYSRGWDERLRKIRESASVLADSKDAEWLAKDIKAVNELAMKIADSLKERVEAGDYKPTVRDYEQLIRLELYLRGLLEGRTEHARPKITFSWVKDTEDRENSFVQYLKKKSEEEESRIGSSTCDTAQGL